ncbi:MAG: hypothetical protein ACRDEA_00115 [Microcystaceae cyanobacterium]
MAIDNSTTQVVVIRSGTGWTVDVTPCNLTTDLTIKDFTVLFDGVSQSLASFTKNSTVLITYGGGSIGSTTVTVRRDTPIARIQEVVYGDRLQSSLWENEFNRVHRVLTEIDQFGTAATTISVSDLAYSVAGWNSVTNVAPSQNAVSDKIEIMISDIAYAGSWDGVTTVAPSKNAVYDQVELRAPKSSPSFTGTVDLGTTATVSTPSKGDNDTSVATSAFVQQSHQPYWIAHKADTTAQTGLTANTDITFGTELVDSDNAFASSVFTVPVGLGGLYNVGCAIQVTNTATATAIAVIEILVNSTVAIRLGEVTTSQLNEFWTMSSSGLIVVASSDVVKVRFGTTVGTWTAGNAAAGANAFVCKFWGCRIAS